MSSITPNARTWTLRFKKNRTTVLLHCDPLQKISSIKEDLLKAVKQSHPDGTIHGYEIPDSAEDILLARPAEPNDLDLGWINLERQNTENDMFAEEAVPSKSRGKGKAPASRGKGKGKDEFQECPQSLGLVDGGVLAFKFTTEEDRALNTREAEDEDAVIIDTEGPEIWDVVVPSMAETYGDDEEGEEEMEDEGIAAD